MQELQILKQLIDSIEEQWGDRTPSERSEIAYTLWEAQSSIKTILDTYKDELRGSDESRVPVSDTAHFHVIESKSNWVLRSDADLLALQRELGSMFNVLFYAKLQTTPKFEETLVGLPERQKTALFNNVEQRQKKATVRLVKQPIRKRT